jgi:ankyrin repeat protein
LILAGSLTSRRFLWVRLQVKHLKDLEKPEKIRRFIQELPIDEEIEATYVQMLKRIEALPENEKRIAQRCLLWVTYAVQPLTQRELEGAIRIEDATSSSEGSETAMILRVCSNFLELEASTEHVVFIHFSAVEFLKGQPGAGTRGIEHYFYEQSAAHLTLAKLCSKYLLRSFTEDEATSALSDTGWFLIGHELAFYACHHFDYHLFEHYSQEGDSIDHDAKECVEEFLACENAVLVGFMLIRTLDDMWSMDLFDKVDFWPGQVSRETIIRSTRLNAIPEFRLPDRTALEEMEANGWILHHAAFSDDIDLVEKILDNAPPEFVRRTDSRGATALYYAARQGNDVVCQRLIDVGQIDPNDGNEFSNPLQAAAFGGHRKVVLLLLGRGANAGLIGGLHNSSLQAAAWGEHYALVYDLLRSGKVNINASSKGSPSTYCALQAAAFRGNDSIVHLLLDAGAEVDIPEPGGEGTQFGLPLQATMHGGHISTAKILLDAGAGINAESGEGGVGGTAATALQAAAWSGHREAVKFLIERNADVKQIAGTHGSALHTALTRGREEVVDILLEKGADIQERVGKYGSSLQAAATSGNERLVRLVLDAGVNPNVKGGYFKSPLIAAAQRGSLSIITMLVEAGADLEKFDGNYGTALDAAAYARHPEIVRYLLEKGATVGGALVEIASSDQVDLAEELIRRGADVNAPGRSPYGVPLQAASWGANPKMVELLLTKGAHVNHRGGVYGNALHAAVYSGSLEAVKLLIQAGADPNNPTGQRPNGTPLQCACIQVHENIVRYLLENGAKANVRPCGEFGTALQAAVVKNYEPIATLLLDHGADVNAVGGKYGTALEAAAFNGNIELATLLINRGANVNEQAGTYGTALQTAAFRAKQDMVKFLLDAKANPNAKGGTFGRPLQAAAYSGNEAVVHLLLDHHAKVNAVSTSKCGTALQAAVQQEHEGIVKILLENGAELLDGRKDQGPLALAQKNGQQKIALMLLDHAQKASDGWEDIGE